MKNETTSNFFEIELCGVKKVTDVKFMAAQDLGILALLNTPSVSGCKRLFFCSQQIDITNIMSRGYTIYGGDIQQ